MGGLGTCGPDIAGPDGHQAGAEHANTRAPVYQSKHAVREPARTGSDLVRQGELPGQVQETLEGRIGHCGARGKLVTVKTARPFHAGCNTRWSGQSADMAGTLSRTPRSSGGVPRR